MVLLILLSLRDSFQINLRNLMERWECKILRWNFFQPSTNLNFLSIHFVQMSTLEWNHRNKRIVREEREGEIEKVRGKQKMNETDWDGIMRNLLMSFIHITNQSSFSVHCLPVGDNPRKSSLTTTARIGGRCKKSRKRSFKREKREKEGTEVRG